ncbi:nucleoside phosphorylase [Arenibacter algicola]|uniref:Uridine phosphorylase n=1 Tax=Arenibacter algicola TaxID=616991 RepID=A0A221V2U2_9FLAO|nr:nucleoside phosphorylase [Arenibacter algicola]ASO07863.1 uridine phosphorylase [Arenibacter algicola]|tara:strand:+ start:5102 stop:5968 length:867 start_codon:yes stop_codon:yes gene_type:complete
MKIGSSELILNADQSVYHLNLLPQDLADTVITVGDPDRVKRVSQFFDKIDLKKGKREFLTHTGWLNNKRISVISTGIGTDNIDIVLNELDALVNIDFETRTVKKDKTRLDIIRIGTSGAIQQDIPVDSFLISEYAIGLDSLLHFYDSLHIQHPEIQEAFLKHTKWLKEKSSPYVVAYDKDLGAQFVSDKMQLGFTATNVGFYGPQGRSLRLKLEDDNMNAKLASFNYKNKRITNLEMETSGIYGLAKLLGHRAVSLNCILANRPNGQFSSRPDLAIDELIKYALNKIA